MTSKIFWQKCCIRLCVALEWFLLQSRKLFFVKSHVHSTKFIKVFGKEGQKWYRFSFENKHYMIWQNKNSLDGWRRNHSNATQCQMRHFCQNILEVKLALEKGCVVKVNFSILYTTIQFIMSYNLKAKIYIFHGNKYRGKPNILVSKYINEKMAHNSWPKNILLTILKMNDLLT